MVVPTSAVCWWMHTRKSTQKMTCAHPLVYRSNTVDTFCFLQREQRAYVRKSMHRLQICLILPRYSAAEGHVDICRLLVSAGANTRERRCDNAARSCGTFFARSSPSTYAALCRDGNPQLTALRIAIMHSKSDVVAYLRSVGAPLWSSRCHTSLLVMQFIRV